MKKYILTCFRPHQGIIEFNSYALDIGMVKVYINRFRPHQGIIEFNKTIHTLH